VPLEDIGFYTLSDYRAEQASPLSPLYRCELILTDRCNFSCPYCRGVQPHLRGDLDYAKASSIVASWCLEGLKNIRFSGGEPTLYDGLCSLVTQAKVSGVQRIAISTNGTASTDLYLELISRGANDFSVSLDACCAEKGDLMSGRSGWWPQVVNNIKLLSKLTYVTVGVVYTDQTVKDLPDIIRFASGLGVSDIRIISAAQYNADPINIEPINECLDKHPILRYRMSNITKMKSVRGIQKTDSRKCYLVLDDMATIQDYHYPCIIYLREQGEPIGRISHSMRQNRQYWFENHDTHQDPICRKNCLDVCVEYNNTVEVYRGQGRIGGREDGAAGAQRDTAKTGGGG
jgi:molybdenum cofactor biosynthesis enzyme MoaA